MAALATGSAGASAADNIKIEHIGVNNTYVRVNPDQKYVILPVQDGVDDARINLIVDGKTERTFYVRLAKSKVDFEVPFDLSKYKGHNVILDIRANHDRSSIRESQEEACWNLIRTSDTFDKTNRENFRPLYHHTPEYGWMNDPNGMFYHDGVWHLYYQWNPYGSKWQNMTWGHSTSRDLIHWTHEGTAIEPDGLGTIFSGSCALDPDNTVGYGKDAVVALYTSAADMQTQSLAGSTDGGITFQKYAGNPVLTLPTEARDPNMFYNPDTKLWTIVLAHALEHEVLFFTSPDLKTWTKTCSFGKVAAQGGVWECPDLFPLEIDGKKKWVLLLNLNPGGPFGGSATQYFIGDYDGKTFTSDTLADGTIPTKWMDFGKDHYATVSWSDAPDSRRTAIGWMSNWQYAADVPTLQYRSANTCPRDLSLFSDNGEIYLASVPSPELRKMRSKASVANVSFSAPAKGRTFALPKANDGICEIEFDIDASKKKGNTEIILSNEKGENVKIIYNAADNTISFDRKESGIVDFSIDFPAVTVAPTFTHDGRTSVHMLIDRSSIEMFAKDGRYAMTNLVFPNQPYSSMKVSSTAGAKISNLNIYPLNPSK
ncbi:MAG: DUF4980 domain-containing protein [Bacteroidales bacterium]|nr:DUF4980 domain-containing protein [Bacteroidales bacterium]